jgi:hypothetical protein
MGSVDREPMINDDEAEMSVRAIVLSGVVLVSAIAGACGEQAGPGEVPAAAPQTAPDVEPARVPEPLLPDTAPRR